jgi:hypothetical protein
LGRGSQFHQDLPLRVLKWGATAPLSIKKGHRKMSKLIFIRYSKGRIIAENIKKINTHPKEEIQKIDHLIYTFCAYIIPTEEEYNNAIARVKELEAIRQEQQEREEFFKQIRKNAIIEAAKAGEISSMQYLIFKC